VYWGNTYRLTYNGYDDFDELPAIAVAGDTVHVVWDRMANGTRSLYYIRKGIGQQGSVSERRAMPIGDRRLTIAPNPVTTGFATIRLSGSSPIVRRSSLSLYDASGRCVQSAICNLESGMRLDLRSMPAGIYLLKVDAGTRHENVKLVVQH
jgi:hypothetical protein